MPETPDLAAMFLAHAKVRLAPPPDASTLNPLLVSAWERARAQWPAVKLSPELFVMHLAQLLPGPLPDGSLEQLFKQMFLEDLYLACACVHQVPMALETFEQHVLRKLPRLLRRRDRSAAEIDEICQETRVKLLVSTSEGPAKLAKYSGKGALLSWAKVIAAHIGARLARAQKPAPEPDDSSLEIEVFRPGESPEIDVLKQYHREDLRSAMHAAFASLSDEERYLLRLHYVERLSGYDLEPLLRMSQPTISRRLKSARNKVYAATQRHLQARLGLPAADFQSFMRLLDSQFDVRISQLLGRGSAPEQPPKKR